jgi:holo-[acyl-carrier protein] synthase
MPPPSGPRIGHDLVDVGRFARALARRRAAFRDRVFTAGEWDAACARPDSDAALAARFAAKEAVMKALGTGWGAGVGWRDVEVEGGGRGAPTLKLHGEAARRAAEAGLVFQVSLSHAGHLASAVALGWPAR